VTSRPDRGGAVDTRAQEALVVTRGVARTGAFARISCSSSREQIGHFDVRRLWRQNMPGMAWGSR
jgi:hypothetical protein